MEYQTDFGIQLKRNLSLRSSKELNINLKVQQCEQRIKMFSEKTKREIAHSEKLSVQTGLILNLCYDVVASYLVKKVVDQVANQSEQDLPSPILFKLNLYANIHCIVNISNQLQKTNNA